MEPTDEPLRDRLLAQEGPTPEALARYRLEVDALLEEVRRGKWWADAARLVLTALGIVILSALGVLFWMIAGYAMVGGANLGARMAASSCPLLAGVACLALNVLLVRQLFRRRGDKLLLEAKRLQAQAIEFEEQVRRRSS